MNYISIMGRITKELEPRTTQSGMPVVQFTLAVNRPVAKGKEQQTDFIPCTAFDKTSELIVKWFDKGRLILVEGRLQVDNYTDNYGTNKTFAKVVVNRVHFTGEKAENENSTASAPVPGMNSGFADIVSYDDEDLPF